MTQPSPFVKPDWRWLWVLLIPIWIVGITFGRYFMHETSIQNELLKKEEAVSAEIKKGNDLQETLWSQKIYNSREGEQLNSQLEFLQSKRDNIWQEHHAHANLGLGYLHWMLLCEFLGLGVLWFSLIQIRKQKTFAHS